MTSSFKHKVALQYLFASSLVIAVVFVMVYGVVRGVAYDNIDRVLSLEARKHSKEIQIDGGEITFRNKKEWEEREHNEAQINPVFIQIMSVSGKVMDKSPNLKDAELPFHKETTLGVHYSSNLKNRPIRIVQLPIIDQDELIGYMQASISMEGPDSVIKKLKSVLLISYPAILIGLFFISQFVAGRSIAPLQLITQATKRITKTNLKQRVPVPETKDELFALSTSINNLLDRLDNAFETERQFASHASHELRTPISAIQGTLEVLIRKSRTEKEYKEKIELSLHELKKMSYTIDQLLLLSRVENQYSKHLTERQTLSSIVRGIERAQLREIQRKQLHFEILNETHFPFEVPKFHSQLILENVIQNAIKYTPEKGRVSVRLTETDEAVICEIKDTGIGIKSEDQEHLFTPFFRSEAVKHKHITGNGIGLSIASKAAKAIEAKITLRSKEKEGTSVLVQFEKA